MKIVKPLEQELLNGLEKNSKNERDLRTLTIWCNPNYIRGSDRDTKIEILKILKNWETEGKTRRETKLLYNKKYELWSLI